MLWSSNSCLRVLDTPGGTILLGLDVLPKPSVKLDFPGGSDGKEFACNEEDPGSIPGLGRSPGEGNDNPLQHAAWRIPWTEEPGRLQCMEFQSQT